MMGSSGRQTGPDAILQVWANAFDDRHPSSHRSIHDETSLNATGGLSLHDSFNIYRMRLRCGRGLQKKKKKRAETKPRYTHFDNVISSVVGLNSLRGLLCGLFQ